MAISNSKWYTLISCCNSDDSFTLNYETTQLELSNGVYVYTGNSFENLIQGTCYEVTLNEGTAPLDGITSLLAPLFSITASENCEESKEESECNCFTSYELQNCFDSSLKITVSIQNPELNNIPLGSVVNLNIGTDPITIITENNLCHTSIEIAHPQINNGLPTPYNITSFVQADLYNGKPYYILTFDENVHGVPGVNLTFYTIYNSIDNRWEIWDTFTLADGPSNTQCSNQQPYMYLTATSSNTGVDCGLTPLTTPNECAYETTGLNCTVNISSNRTVEYCSSEIVIEDFINCWEVIEKFNTPSDLEYNIISTFETCNACINDSNTPPCIRATNCSTGEIIYFTLTSNLENYIGKIIKVLINNEVTCLLIEYSEICPDEANILSEVIISSFSDCDSCLEKPIIFTYRYIKPNFDIKECSIKEFRNIKCNFADSIYSLYKSLQYGMNTCCTEDIDNTYIKNKKYDLNKLYDAELCKEEVENVGCCSEPCLVTVEIILPNWESCIAPNNIEAEINTDCDTPESLEVEFNPCSPPELTEEVTIIVRS